MKYSAALDIARIGTRLLVLVMVCPRIEGIGYAWVAWYPMVCLQPRVTLTAYLPSVTQPLLSIPLMLHISSNTAQCTPRNCIS